MELIIPGSLKLQHVRLAEEIARASTMGGRIGDAAKAVADILQPHLAKEEEYILSLLGMLPVLAEGQVTPEMRDVLPNVYKLRGRLKEMLEEHKEILATLKYLMGTTNEESNTQVVRFAEELALHLQTEEQVLYPAAVLIGRYCSLDFLNG